MDTSFQEMLQGLNNELEETSRAGVLAIAGLAAFSQGLQAGFAQAFAGILGQTSTWGTAIKAIWGAILNSLLSAAGSALGKVISNVVVPAIGAFISGGAGAGATSFILGASPAPGSAPGRARRAMQEESLQSSVFAPTASVSLPRLLQTVPALAVAQTGMFRTAAAPAYASFADRSLERALERALSPLLAEFRQLTTRAATPDLGQRTMERLERIMSGRADGSSTASRRALAQGF